MHCSNNVVVQPGKYQGKAQGVFLRQKVAASVAFVNNAHPVNP